MLPAGDGSSASHAGPLLHNALPCCLQVAQDGEEVRGFHPVAVLLSYLTKAPLVPEGHPLVNALAKQRAALENMFRACVGLPPENNMLLEFK